MPKKDQYKNKPQPRVPSSIPSVIDYDNFPQASSNSKEEDESFTLRTEHDIIDEYYNPPDSQPDSFTKNNNNNLNDYYYPKNNDGTESKKETIQALVNALTGKDNSINFNMIESADNPVNIPNVHHSRRRTSNNPRINRTQPLQSIDVNNPLNSDPFNIDNGNNSPVEPIINNGLPYGMSEKNPYVPAKLSDNIRDKIEEIQKEQIYENQYKKLPFNLTDPDFADVVDIIPQVAIERTSNIIHDNVVNRLNNENVNPNNKQEVNKIIQEEAKKVNDAQFVYKDDIEAWKDRWESLKGIGRYLLDIINKYKRYAGYGLAGTAATYGLYKLIQYLRNRPKAPAPVLPPAPVDTPKNNVRSPIIRRQRTSERRRRR